MKSFKVTATGPHGVKDVFKPWYPSSTYRRSWTFEAESEEQVRALWDEAKKEDLEEVRDYVLESIREVSP